MAPAFSDHPFTDVIGLRGSMEVGGTVLIATTIALSERVNTDGSISGLKIFERFNNARVRVATNCYPKAELCGSFRNFDSLGCITRVPMGKLIRAMSRQASLSKALDLFRIVDIFNSFTTLKTFVMRLELTGMSSNDTDTRRSMKA